MKKLLLCTVLAVCATCAASAQKKIAFGVRAGLNINSLSYSGDKNSEMPDPKSRAGFHVGAVMDWNVAGNFYIQPGLYFTTRGAKSEDSMNEDGYRYEYSDKLNMNYLQLPVVASYRFPVSKAVKIDINVGPYVAVGLGGKYKIEETEFFEGETERYSYECKIFDKSTEEEGRGDFKRFDAGLRFGAGVNIQKFYVGLSYDLGLTNLARTDGDSHWAKGTKYKNGSFQVSVGYNF